MAAKTILLYGRSRAGKSTQIGELAEHVYVTTGKKTRVYTADRGGVDPIKPYIDLGIIEVVSQDSTDIWHFLDKSASGLVRDDKGKWVPGSEVGLVAFESMTAFAEALMNSLAEKAAQGVNIGGGGNSNLTITDNGDTLKIGSNNVSHYNVAQVRITDSVWRSQRIPADYVLWTASASKDEDNISTSKVLGPQVVGKALTAEVPRWFGLSFRIDCIPAQMGKPERHILYLGNSVDSTAGGATSLGNTRTPKDSVELPSSIEPASLVKAIQLIDAAQNQAITKIKSRLNLK